jgi:hypothetical protein
MSGCGSAIDNSALLEDNAGHVSSEVTVRGAVTRLLPDSNGTDGPHQNFDLDVSGVVVQIIHNLDLARRVPVRTGDIVVVHGQFEPDPGHPVIHYTHHSTDRHESGYIQLDGQTYQ